MKLHFLTLMLIVSITAGAGNSLGIVINVPSNVPSIGEALAMAEAGDQINIEPGQYFEFNLIVPSRVSLSGLGNNPEQVVINAQGQGRVMICDGLDETTLIQNMTFLNGHASGEQEDDQNGGAILLNNSTLRLVNCRFINNSAAAQGGALRFTHSSPEIINCHFSENSAPEGGGGAIDCSYNSHLQLDNCFFELNTANWGGALSCRGDSAPHIYDSIFIHNQATGNLGYGGAALADFGAEPFFESCTFYGNEARYGGAVASFSGSQINLQSCTLVGNTSQWVGAGIICSNSYPIIENSIIAFQNGSSIACGESALPMISCTNIYGNTQGDWIGTIEPQLQTFNNMSVDPLFCEMNPGLEYEFRLRSDSPCAGENSDCSVMGAWSAGCDITPVYIDDFAATWSNGVPLISWQTNDQKFLDDFVLMRSLDSENEEPRPVAFQPSNNGGFVAHDYEFPTGNSEDLIYRLYRVQDDDSLVLISQARLSNDHILKPLYLAGASPNPFNPRTTISFETSLDRMVTISVHNIRGQQVNVLTRQHYAAGAYELVWEGVDGDGRKLESGTYFITISADGMVRSQKVTLIK